MNLLSRRFIINNVITTILVIALIPFFRIQHSSFFDGGNYIFGALAILAYIGGSWSSIVICRELTHKRLPTFAWWEKIILTLIYIFAIGANNMLLAGGINMSIGSGSLTGDSPAMIPFVVLILANFGMIGTEIYYMSDGAKKPPKRPSPSRPKWASP